ncbi:hypothetical protein [Mucilaginibacter sp.]|uniref:hypothetical protein n=1 Tax=Mucilaginibacter sp. TaxID=1882438 RepID=UPI002626E51E|nr:hypothetical protein [Mucilaginibacter sp.]MDB5029724.1 hypothetical protein [Mucilaginibacter sp.]
MENTKETYPLWNEAKTIGSDDMQVSLLKSEDKTAEENVIANPISAALKFPGDWDLLPCGTIDKIILYVE